MDAGVADMLKVYGFEVGKNVAVSEGAVIFENELFQLIGTGLWLRSA